MNSVASPQSADSANLPINKKAKAVQKRLATENTVEAINEDTTPEPEIVPIFLNEGGRYGDLGPMLCGSCFAQKFEDAGMPEYTYTTQPLPGQSAEKGTADE